MRYFYPQASRAQSFLSNVTCVHELYFHNRHHPPTRSSLILYIYGARGGSNQAYHKNHLYLLGYCGPRHLELKILIRLGALHSTKLKCFLNKLDHFETKKLLVSEASSVLFRDVQQLEPFLVLRVHHGLKKANATLSAYLRFKSF